MKTRGYWKTRGTWTSSYNYNIKVYMLSKVAAFKSSLAISGAIAGYAALYIKKYGKVSILLQINLVIYINRSYLIYYSSILICSW